MPFDNGAAGDAYENFMGGWSRRVADLSLEWLPPRPGDEAPFRVYSL